MLSHVVWPAPITCRLQWKDSEGEDRPCKRSRTPQGEEVADVEAEAEAEQELQVRAACRSSCVVMQAGWSRLQANSCAHGLCL